MELKTICQLQYGALALSGHGILNSLAILTGKHLKGV